MRCISKYLQEHYNTIYHEYSYERVHQLKVEDFVVEIHHGHFTFSLTCFFDFQYNNIPLGSVSTASASGHFDYLYACINQLIVEDFVVEIHHRRRHFFFERFIFIFRFTVVIEFLPGTFHFLTEPGIFCCV